MRIKDEGFITVDIEEGVGYTIRHKNYSGATITVTESGGIQIGQSYRVLWRPDDWNLINKEIELGKAYMAKVLFAGYPKKQKKQIRPKCEPSGLYIRDNDTVVLYLGTGVITHNTCGFTSNRLNCYELYAVINNMSFVNNITTTGSSICIQMPQTDSLRDFIDFDSYRGKPTKLKSLEWIGTKTETSVIINNIEAFRFNRVAVRKLYR